MKNLLIGLLLTTSVSSFADEVISQKLYDQGILCSYEIHISDKAWEALKKDPQNEELKKEMERTQELYVDCGLKAEVVAAQHYDGQISCEDAIEAIMDGGGLCTAEVVAGDIAFFLAKNNQTQANLDLMAATQQAYARCLSLAYKVCN